MDLQLHMGATSVEIKPIIFTIILLFLQVWAINRRSCLWGYELYCLRAGAYQANPPSVSTAKGIQNPRDISAALDNQVKLRHEELDWRRSIVDLMKVLRLDPGADARKRLAIGAGYDGDMDDLTAMNIWLLSCVKEAVAAAECDLTGRSIASKSLR